MPDDAVTSGGVDVHPDDHLTYLIARAAHVLELRIQDAVAEAGLTLRQSQALVVISRQPGLSSSDLARLLLTTPQSVNTLIARLVAAGLVHRAPSRPRQPLVLTLTEAGSEALRKAEPLASQAEASALAKLDPEDVDAVRRGLLTLLEQVKDDRRSRLAHRADKEYGEG